VKYEGVTDGDSGDEGCDVLRMR